MNTPRSSQLPTQRAERTPPCLRSVRAIAFDLETQPHVGRQPQAEADAVGRREALVVAGVAVFPSATVPPVVEFGLAVQHHLDLAVHAGVPVQNRAEDAWAIQSGQAQPFDLAAGCHQRHDLAVGQEAVLPDRSEWRHTGPGGNRVRRLAHRHA